LAALRAALGILSMTVSLSLQNLSIPHRKAESLPDASESAANTEESLILFPITFPLATFRFCCWPFF
jgi:hypothetical protein